MTTGGLRLVCCGGTSTLPFSRGHAGSPVTLLAKLTNAANVLLNGEPLSFSVAGAGAGSATTNRSGVASLSYTIPAGTVHDAKVHGDKALKVLGVYVVDKTKPLASPAP